jgi:hypothetical protein
MRDRAAFVAIAATVQMTGRYQAGLREGPHDPARAHAAVIGA